MSVLTLEAKLERTEGSTPWGFRMQGGKDFSSPLTIQRVNPGSLASKCGLQVGDIILKIGSTSTDTLRHKDAQDSIIRSGNHLDLLLQRGGTGGYDKFNAPQISPGSFNPNPQPFNPAPTSPSQHSLKNFNSKPKPFQSSSPSTATTTTTSNNRGVSPVTANSPVRNNARMVPNFNSAPRPFGAPAASPAPPAPRDYSDGGLSHQTQNLSLASGAPISPVSAPHPVHKVAPAPTPAYQAPPSQPANAPKPWIANPPVAPVSNATPKPFGANPAAPPPKPSGVGATRGKKGDAAMNAAPLPTGRIPVCSGCNMPIRGPFVTALGKCWCPDHFVCANAQCGVKLLDIGFVEESGFLYCEKDYAVHFAPHCDKCGRAIIGECVNAMNKSFHKECFLCTHCNKPIGGNQFHLEDGKFYCENDWNVLFQTMCSGCDFPIEPGDAWVEALGKNYHSECFNCSKCQVNLEGQQFVAKAGKPYCKQHAR